MLPSPSRLRPLDDELLQQPRQELRLVPRESRVAVLLNANAKQVNARVRRAFEAVVPRSDLFFSTSMATAEAHARDIIDRRYDVVMAGGGDGTITSTMNLLLQASARGHSRAMLPDIGILPLGTGNGLAALTGAAAPIAEVSRLLNGTRPAAHPLRLIEDPRTGWAFPFCSVGYDAQLLNDFVAVSSGAKTPLEKAIKKSLAGYFLALGTRTIPHELRGDRPHVRVVAKGRASMIDPETHEEIPLENGATLFEGAARAVTAGTSPFYGYGICVHPFARRRTDRFHVRVSNMPISFLLARLPSLWKGTLRSNQLFDFLVEGVTIESDIPMPLQMAGDARGQTQRVELQLADRAFRFLEGSGRARF